MRIIMKTKYQLQFFLLVLLIASFYSCKKEITRTETPRFRARHAATILRSFYVSSSTGNDANDGLTTSTPLKTIKKLSTMTFSPGDAILFKAGDVWSGDTTLLRPKGSGTSANPITIDRYGSGAAPVISITNFPNTTGGVFGVVMLSNQSYWYIHNLSIIAANANPLQSTSNPDNTSQASIAGIYVKNSPNSATQSNITIEHCTVNSITNNNNANTRAILGIGFEGAYNSLVVDSCTVDSCLAGIHSNANLAWINPANSNYASTNITFSNNLVENVFGNGIVIGTITNGLITNNRVIRCCNWFGAGIWVTHSTNSIIQYNEVSDQFSGSQDGQAFDDDDDEGPSSGDIFQYNYSHNNSHGFMLIMPTANYVTVRFNVSINDGGNGGVSGISQRIFGLASSSALNSSASIYNNVFYIGSGITTRVIGTYGSSGTYWAPKFYDNIFYVDGGAISAFSEQPLNSATLFQTNCLFPASTFSSAANYPAQTSPITSDPLFNGEASYGTGFGANAASQAGTTVNFSPAISAFGLQSTSPCINTGYAVSNSGTYDFAHTNIVGRVPSVGAVWPLTGPLVTYYNITNRSTGNILNLQNNTGKVELTVISKDSTSAQWSEELHNGYTRFRNRKTGQYMNEENALAYEQYGNLVSPDQWSCDFSLVANGSYTRLQNRYTSKFVNNKHNYGYAETTANFPTSDRTGDWTITVH